MQNRNTSNDMNTNDHDNNNVIISLYQYTFLQNSCAKNPNAYPLLILSLPMAVSDVKWFTYDSVSLLCA